MIKFCTHIGIARWLLLNITCVWKVFQLSPNENLSVSLVFPWESNARTRPFFLFISRHYDNVILIHERYPPKTLFLIFFTIRILCGHTCALKYWTGIWNKWNPRIVYPPKRSLYPLLVIINLANCTLVQRLIDKN